MTNENLQHDLLVKLIGEAAEKCDDLELLDLVHKLLTEG